MEVVAEGGVGVVDTGDAVHLAAAHRVPDPNVVMVAGDNALVEAASAESMAVAELP